MIQRAFVGRLLERFQSENPLIQLVIGSRQVGKTTGIHQLLQQYNGEAHYASADGVYTSGESWIFEQWQTAQLKGRHALLVIDEIQKLQNWSETIKKLWDKSIISDRPVKLLLSGSSSLSLKQGATESLAGRLEMIHVWHWDFIESKKLSNLSLEDYLKFGGYPKSYDYLDDPDRWMGYVKNSIVDRVIHQDILSTGRIQKPALFRQAFELVSCYPSQEISYRKLLGQLQDRGNTDLIKTYLALFESAFLIKLLEKYQNQAFRVKSSSPKILLLATCFHTLFSAKDEKYALLFENSVGAKLLQIATKLYYWRKDQQEVDFIMQWRDQLVAIEVKSGRKRKSSGLMAFQAQYPHAKLVMITPENYAQFIEQPIQFFEILIS